MGIRKDPSRIAAWEAEAKAAIRKVLASVKGAKLKSISYDSSKRRVGTGLAGYAIEARTVHDSDFVFVDEHGATVEVAIRKTVYR